MLTDEDFESLRKTLTKWIAKKGDFGKRVAEDVTQSALLRLWEHMQDGEEIRDPLAWCRRFVLRHYVRQAQRITRQIPILDLYVDAPRFAKKLILEISPEDILAGKEEFDRIPDRLKALTILREEDAAGNIPPLTGAERVALHRLRAQAARDLGRTEED